MAPMMVMPCHTAPWNNTTPTTTPTPMAASSPAVIASLELVLLTGIPASNIVAREAATEDPGFVVVDEVAGQWVALIAASTRPWEWLLAFLLFRVFDILKPSPARQFDRMHSGFGIMMDDVAAGIYAMAILWLARLFSTGWRF